MDLRDLDSARTPHNLEAAIRQVADEAFTLLGEGLQPIVRANLKERYSSNWWKRAQHGIGRIPDAYGEELAGDLSAERLAFIQDHLLRDPSASLNLLAREFSVFARKYELTPRHRVIIENLRELDRNELAHWRLQWRDGLVPVETLLLHSLLVLRAVGEQDRSHEIERRLRLVQEIARSSGEPQQRTGRGILRDPPKNDRLGVIDDVTGERIPIAWTALPGELRRSGTELAYDVARDAEKVRAVRVAPAPASKDPAQCRAAAREARETIGLSERGVETLADPVLLRRYGADLRRIVANELGTGELGGLEDVERLILLLLDAYRTDDVLILLADAGGTGSSLSADARDWLEYWRLRVAARRSSPDHHVDQIQEFLNGRPQDERDATLQADILTLLADAQSYRGTAEEADQSLCRALGILADAPYGRGGAAREMRIWDRRLGNAAARGQYGVFKQRLNQAGEQGPPDAGNESEWRTWFSLTSGSLSQHQRRFAEALSHFLEAKRTASGRLPEGRRGEVAAASKRLSIETALAHARIEVGSLSIAEGELGDVMAREGDPALDPQVFAYARRHVGHLEAARERWSAAADLYEESATGYVQREATRGTLRSWVLRARALGRAGEWTRASDTLLPLDEASRGAKAFDLNQLRHDVRLLHWTALWDAVLGGASLCEGDREGALALYCEALTTALPLSRFVVDEVVVEICTHLERSSRDQSTAVRDPLTSWWEVHGREREEQMRGQEDKPEDEGSDLTTLQRLQDPSIGALPVAVAPRW